MCPSEQGNATSQANNGVTPASLLQMQAAQAIAPSSSSPALPMQQMASRAARMVGACLPLVSANAISATLEVTAASVLRAICALRESAALTLFRCPAAPGLVITCTINPLPVP